MKEILGNPALHWGEDTDILQTDSLPIDFNTLFARNMIQQKRIFISIDLASQFEDLNIIFQFVYLSQNTYI